MASLKWEEAGAGLGTALAYWGLLVVAFIVFRKHPVLKEYDVLKWSGIDVKMWKEPFKIGLPIGLSVFAEVAVFAFVGLLMSKFGTSIIASHQAANEFCDGSLCIPD